MLKVFITIYLPEAVKIKGSALTMEIHCTSHNMYDCDILGNSCILHGSVTKLHVHNQFL